MGNNIVYKTKQIKDFYSHHRKNWDEFYPSERWVFEKVFSDKPSAGDILDVGCACGGLGLALSERFSLNSYTGVDINEEAIEWAKKGLGLSFPATFISGDIVGMKLDASYDTVISLGCADWNIESSKIISSCWEKVREGGSLVISLRLTDKEGVSDIKKSYQHINFNAEEKNPEKANYVVFNSREALALLKNLSPKPELIGAYGYWGKPSATAVTCYDRIAFSVFYIKKAKEGFVFDTRLEMNLPEDVFA